MTSVDRAVDIVCSIACDRSDIMLGDVHLVADELIACWTPRGKDTLSKSDFHVERLPIAALKAQYDSQAVVTAIWDWCKKWTAKGAVRFRRFSRDAERCS